MSQGLSLTQSAQSVRQVLTANTKKYWQRLRELPEYKREFAKRELENIVNRYLGDDDRTEDAIELMLKGLEQDEYWAVMNALINANPADIASVAEALSRFGVVGLAMVAGERKPGSMRWLRCGLANDMDTLEARMHEPIEANLRVFGSDYALLSSNQALQTIIPKALSSLRSQRRFKTP